MTETVALRLHDGDNIMVALTALAPGAEVAEGVAVAESIAAGHKVAIRAIGAGETVIKYGQIIGTARPPRR